MRVRSLLLVLALGLGACAPIPAPRILEEVDEVAKSPSALDAKEYARPAWDRAEKLRLEAWEAQKNGTQSEAQFLAEQSLATFREAAARARLAKAELRLAKADADAATLETELTAAEAELARATQDLDALELRLRVARDAQAPGVSGTPDTPEREAARREAARALLAQGQMLCASARLLGVGKAAASGAPASGAAPAAEDPTSPEVLARDLGKAEAQLTELEGALAKTDKPTPIDLASRSRAACLSVLSRARRASAPQGATGSADALLQELSGLAAATQKQGSLDPERDERGVVLTLRAAFDGDAPSAAARARLEELDRVANAHPSFPVAVIVHTDKPMKDADKTVWMSRGQALAALLKSVPSDKKVVVVAGDALPATAVASEKAKNARVEIVFIAPEAL